MSSLPAPSFANTLPPVVADGDVAKPLSPAAPADGDTAVGDNGDTAAAAPAPLSLAMFCTEAGNLPVAVADDDDDDVMSARPVSNDGGETELCLALMVGVVGDVAALLWALAVRFTLPGGPASPRGGSG